MKIARLISCSLTLVGLSSGWADDGVSVVFEEMPVGWTQKAADVAFVAPDRLVTIQPQFNAYTTMRWSGSSISGETFSDCYRPGLDTKTFCEVHYDSQWRNPAYCSGLFCIECKFYDKKGAQIIRHLARPFVGARAIDSLPNGDVIVTPQDGKAGLGLYRFSTGPWINGELDLYTVCSTFGGGQGQQSGDASLVEFDLGIGVDLGAFSLSYNTDPFNGEFGPPSGRIVGAVDLGNGSGNSETPRAKSRRGSGTGGTGPYPGVDANWSATEADGPLSLGRRTATADFNGDGWEDLILLHPEENSASVLPFIGLADFYDDDANLIPSGAEFGDPIVPSHIPTTPSLVGTGDFDGNGTEDFILWGKVDSEDPGNEKGYIHYGNGDGSFSNATVIATGSAVTSMQEMLCVDLNGDGIDEIVFTRNGTTPTENAMLTIYRRPTPPYTRWWNNVEIPNSNGAHVMAMDVRPDPGSGQAAILLRVNEPQATLHAWAEYEPFCGEYCGECGDPNSGGCFTPHDGPFCADPECCAMVCGYDPHCCVEDWDSSCASNAGYLCYDIMEEHDRPILWRVPAAVASANVTAISLSSDHTLALADGLLVGFGENGRGQCDVPSAIAGTIQSFQAIDRGSFAIDTSNNVHFWGHAIPSLSIPPEIQGRTVALSADRLHAAALLDDGSIVCWGYIQGSSVDPPDTLGTTVQVVVAADCILALDTEGVIVGWGRTEADTQGDPNDLFPIPQSIQGQVVSFDATASRGLAMLNDGSMVEWSHGEIQKSFSADSLGAVRSFQADRFILGEDGKLTPLDRFPGGLGNIPEDCTLLACGTQHAIAMGRKASVKGVLAQIELDPVGNPDINNDGIVDGADLSALLGAWGATGPADLNQSGEVDGTDLMILLSAWGSSG